MNTIAYGLSLQHTGTFWLLKTFTVCTGLPACMNPQTPGLVLSHMYVEGLNRTRDERLQTMVDSDLPIIVPIRHPQKSVSTLVHRSSDLYTVEAHIGGFRRLVGMLNRVHLVRVDCESDDRENVLRGMCRHVGVESVEDDLLDWASRWPIINTHNSPYIKEPKVPNEIVEALGYEATTWQ